eukprot:1144255-Pelagomonas_calceolata.AAC.13
MKVSQRMVRLVYRRTLASAIATAADSSAYGQLCTGALVVRLGLEAVQQQQQQQQQLVGQTQTGRAKDFGH